MRLCLVVALCLSAKFDGFIISRGIGGVFVVVPIEYTFIKWICLFMKMSFADRGFLRFVLSLEGL